MSKRKIYFGGCSITHGDGYADQSMDPRIYANLVSRHYDMICDNQAENGSSNLKIFMRAAKNLIPGEHDIYVIQWSSVQRHWLYPAPDRALYLSSAQETMGDDRDFEIEFQLRNHDYGNVLAVIDYTRILTHMAHSHGKTIVFVNGMLHWTPDMLQGSMSSDYARSLLGESNVRYAEALKNNLELLDWSIWANAWHSIFATGVDRGPLGHHPGPLTHKNIADNIIKVIDSKRP